MVRVVRNFVAQPWYPALYVLFLLSGFSGLVYEVAWVRQFGLIFGVTAYAVGAVLSAYFGGLALGSWLASRWLRRARFHPLRLYGILELGVGAFALALPFLLARLNGFYAWLFPLTSGSFYVLSLVRFAASFLVLLLPTTLMGASLPLVTEALGGQIQDATLNVSGLYAINTLGALAGAAFSGFYGIGHFGMFETTLIAVGGNGLAFVGAQWVAGKVRVKPPAGWEAPREERVDPSLTRSDRDRRRVVLMALALSGFAALGYEVVWTRVLGAFMGRTVFAFTTILCSSLLGIAAGSWIIRLFSARIKQPLVLLALLELGVAWLSLASIFLVGGSIPGRSLWGLPISLGTVLIFPNLLLGATLPMAVRLYQDELERVGSSLGELYSANVLGGVLGSFCASFVLLPWIGSQGTVSFLCVANIVVAALLVRGRVPLWSPWPLAAGGVSAAILAFLAGQPLYMYGGMNRAMYGDQKLLFQHEDTEAIVTVSEKDGVRSVYMNGGHESDDSPGTLLIHRRLAHLPLLLHPKPQSILIVGLGGGTTAGAAVLHPVGSIRIVELVPGMIQGAALFRRTNYGVLNDPRTKLDVDDGRNYLLLSNDKYDVIESDVIYPYRAGANNIYSTQYYELIRSHLKPGGMVSQWIDPHLSVNEYKLLLRSFLKVFPNSTLWDRGEYAAAMPDGVSIDGDLVRQRFNDPALAEVWRSLGYKRVEDFLASFTMGPQEAADYVGEGPVLTDNHPYLEYLPLEPHRARVRLRNGNITPFLRTGSQ